MDKTYTYPFGQTVKPVVQADQTPKKNFILGVYASAVHARWVDANGKEKIKALAVASEPYIFWHGNGAEAIINQIDIPAEAGKLLPAARHLNGPSGKVLDDQYLKPLNLTRDDVWLCDLTPHSLLNDKQYEAIQKHYVPLMEQFNLPEVTLPCDTQQYADDQRGEEIIKEIEASQAETIILLGQYPIQQFLTHFGDYPTKLSDYSNEQSEYGQIHQVTLAGKSYQFIPLTHPRNAGRLGSSSNHWAQNHTHWVEHTAPTLNLG